MFEVGAAFMAGIHFYAERTVLDSLVRFVEVSTAVVATYHEAHLKAFVLYRQSYFMSTCWLTNVTTTNNSASC